MKKYVECVYDGDLLLRNVRLITARSRAEAVEKSNKHYNTVLVLTPAEARRIGKAGEVGLPPYSGCDE